MTRINNVAGTLYQLFGEQLLDEHYPVDILSAYGIDPLPPSGRLFVSLSRHIANTGGDPVKELDKAKEELDLAKKTLWSPRRFPRIAGWIAANQRALDKVLKLPEDGRFFLPVASNSTTPFWDSLFIRRSSSSLFRELINVLVARATLKAESGNVKGAWTDIMAVRRLSNALHHSNSRFLLIVGLVANSQANIASQTLATSGLLSNAEAKRFLRELQQIRPMHNEYMEHLQIIERCENLDSLMSLARTGPEVFDAVCNDPGWENSGWDTANPAWRASSKHINWNRILYSFNKWFDNGVEATRKELHSPYSDRALAEYWKATDDYFAPLAVWLAQLGWVSDQKNIITTAVNLIIEHSSRSGGIVGPDAATERIGMLFTYIFRPNNKIIVKVQRKKVQEWQVTVLAMALAAYKAEHGNYPEPLAALSPKYVKQVPQDMFTGKPLKYEKNGNGYLLYGIGPNRKDEGGSDEGDADDVSVRAASD